MTMREVAEQTSFDGYALYLTNVKLLDNIRPLNSFCSSEIIARKVRKIKSMIRIVENGETNILLPIKAEDLNKIFNGEKTILVQKSILNDMRELIVR